jgi:hypothetical protein
MCAASSGRCPLRGRIGACRRASYLPALRRLAASRRYLAVTCGAHRLRAAWVRADLGPDGVKYKPPPCMASKMTRRACAQACLDWIGAPQSTKAFTVSEATGWFTSCCALGRGGGGGRRALEGRSLLWRGAAAHAWLPPAPLKSRGRVYA